MDGWEYVRLFRILGNFLLLLYNNSGRRGELKRIKYKLRKSYTDIKCWLEKNKIFFETIVMMSLTAMSIIVSWNANKIATEENRLTERELEIENAEKMPHFTIRYHDDMETYDIFNSGGEISDAMASFDYYICMNVFRENLNKEIVVGVSDAYQKTFVNYDYDNNTFTDIANGLLVYNIMETVTEWGKKQGILLNFEVVEISEITYNDYIGEAHDERYKIDTLKRSYMEKISDEEYYSMMEKYEFPIYGKRDKSDEIINNSIEELENIILEKLNIKQ